MPQAGQKQLNSESFDVGADGALEDGEESVRAGEDFEDCSDEQGGNDGNVLPRAGEQGYLAGWDAAAKSVW